jgi:hypothetical protein
MAADAGRAVGHVAKTGSLRRGHRPLRRPHSVHAAVDGLQPGIPFGTFQVTPFRVYAIHELPRGFERELLFIERCGRWLVACRHGFAVDRCRRRRHRGQPPHEKTLTGERTEKAFA